MINVKPIGIVTMFNKGDWVKYKKAVITEELVRMEGELITDSCFQIEHMCDGILYGRLPGFPLGFELAPENVELCPPPKIEQDQ
tara:strand:+ start:122 stop:373 length:252 start_codon:yes stop_codon:yes gene_type:complete